MGEMRVNTVRVGTRGSLLATTQTGWVVDRLKRAHPGRTFETIEIRTTGDLHSETVPAKALDKGHFTREIEDALLAGEIDLAIHSLKDLPGDLPEGLALGAVPGREDSRDVLVGATRDELTSGVTVGTSSVRRAAQLRRSFPGSRVVDLRGNLDTRLRKVREGVVDCAVLAAAGLARLGREEEISFAFNENEMLPAPGQGALGIELRADDAATKEIVATIHCVRTFTCVTAERAFLEALGGGCQVPVAALATIEDNELALTGRVVSPDGKELFENTRQGRPEEAEATGRELAATLTARGAGRIIEAVLAGGDG